MFLCPLFLIYHNKYIIPSYLTLHAGLARLRRGGTSTAGRSQRPALSKHHEDNRQAPALGVNTRCQNLQGWGFGYLFSTIKQCNVKQ